MKISKRTREQAALLCQVAASNEDGGGAVAHHLDMPGDAYRLARAAFVFALKSLPVNEWLTPEAAFAEAESMLRTGWTPWTP